MAVRIAIHHSQPVRHNVMLLELAVAGRPDRRRGTVRGARCKQFPVPSC